MCVLPIQQLAHVWQFNMYRRWSAVMVPAEDGWDNTVLVLARLAPAGASWRARVHSSPDLLHTQELNPTHQNPMQHIPLRNTTAERLCYDISNQEPRQADGFGGAKGIRRDREKRVWG